MVSVLYMDIVSYSLEYIDDQTELLAILQKTVRESPEFNQGISKEELTLLPTGDGMALVFFRRDPVSPVKCALEIAASLKDHPEIKLRMGIHHGPVRRQLDIKDELNVVGGGINKAQRVMDFGDAGHILLSRNVAEVLEQFKGWNDCLRDLGRHRVKHRVKVHLYNLCKDGLGNRRLPWKVVVSRWKWPSVAVVVVLLAVAGLGWRQNLGNFARASICGTSPRVDSPVQPITQNPAVSVGDGLPFRVVLEEDIPAGAEHDQALRFTLADGLKVGDTVVIAKGAAVTGSIVTAAGKKNWFGKGGKMTFRLLQADAVDGKKLNVRATPSRGANGLSRPLDTGKGAKSKEFAAARGTEYVGYTDGQQTVSVPK